MKSTIAATIQGIGSGLGGGRAADMARFIRRAGLRRKSICFRLRRLLS
jgi:hypothetical protein